MRSVRDWSVDRLTRIVLPFFAVALIGIVVRIRYPDTAPLQSTVHMLGDALVVGAVIALTLEFFASRRLIDDAAAELSERLVGEGLPHAVQASISAVVHDTTIVIDDVVVRYRIQSINGNRDHVRVQIQRSYRATNFSRRNIDYKPSLAEEHFHSPKFVSLHCDPGVAGVVYSLDGLQLSQRVTTAPGSHVKTVVGNPTTLRPVRTDASRASCRCTWSYELTTPAIYSDVISFARPAVGATVIVDEVPDGFSFAATDDTRWTERTDRQWVYRRAFLAEQHIRVWWSDRDSLL